MKLYGQILCGSTIQRDLYDSGFPDAVISNVAVYSSDHYRILLSCKLCHQEACACYYGSAIVQASFDAIVTFNDHCSPFALRNIKHIVLRSFQWEQLEHLQFEQLTNLDIVEL
jgi:hypothetical protein